MKTFIVIPNWNGKDRLKSCLESVKQQSQQCQTVVVDNGSVDGSSDFIRNNYPWVHVIQHEKNEGFAGGVNAGIRYALDNNADYIALLNNDATIDKDWLKQLVNALENHSEAGAATCKLLSADRQCIDNTGDFYTSWGLPMARQRNDPASSAKSSFEYVFGACAGAGVYRSVMIKGVGLFDERFFAYYEDSDFNFRMQLAGWKAVYEPKAEAYHATGSTSSSIKGFTTYQTMKNLPMLMWKNVPFPLVLHVFPRLFLTYWLVMASSIVHGRGWPALKGVVMWHIYVPYASIQRWQIQRNRKVSADYIRSLIVFDLPKDSRRLRKLRSILTLGRK